MFFFLTNLLHVVLFSFSSCSLKFLSSQTNRSCQFFTNILRLYTLLYILIFLFFSQELGISSLESLSSYGKSLRLRAIFVAALSILSIFLISFFLCCDLPHSNFGWINIINMLIISSSRYFEVILIFLSSWYVSPVISLICFSGDKLSVIHTLKSFSTFVLLIYSFLIEYFPLYLILQQPISSTIHFLALNSISQSLLYLWIFSNPFVNAVLFNLNFS